MKLICALLIVLSLGTTSLHADPIKPKIVPECTLVDVVGGIKMCAYTLEEWKIVLKLDTELYSARRVLELERQKSKLLETQVNDLKEQVALYIDNQNLALAYLNETTKQLIAKDRELQKERAKPIIGSTIAWTVAAISTAILGGVLLENALD